MKENTNYIPSTLILEYWPYLVPSCFIYIFSVVYSILLGHITLSENKDLL